MNRAERERQAYDGSNIWETSDRWHARFAHVFKSPNTLRHERLFGELIREKASGSRVLELGCGDGLNARGIAEYGARYVLGIDVSERFLDMARPLAVAGRLEFANADASAPITGQFDLIVGRSILHHIDYRETMRRLYDDNLAPGGLMVFMEPLGSNPLIRFYTWLVPRAHTPDERSFRGDDIRWFRGQFAGFELYPFNYFSLPLGLVSSKLLKRPDNILLRIADWVDVKMARATRRLDAQFRHAIFVVRKADS